MTVGQIAALLGSAQEDINLDGVGSIVIVMNTGYISILVPFCTPLVEMTDEAGVGGINDRVTP